MNWTASEAAEEQHRAEHTIIRVVRCKNPDCEAVGEREVFEGEALDGCIFCDSTEVERP